MTKKGTRPPNAGKGRPKGSPNRYGREAQAMIVKALHELGGVEYLTWLGRKHPRAFAPLVGRIVPRELRLDSPDMLTLAKSLRAANEREVRLRGESLEEQPRRHFDA